MIRISAIDNLLIVYSQLSLHVGTPSHHISETSQEGCEVLASSNFENGHSGRHIKGKRGDVLQFVELLLSERGLVLRVECLLDHFDHAHLDCHGLLVPILLALSKSGSHDNGMLGTANNLMSKGSKLLMLDWLHKVGVSLSGGLVQLLVVSHHVVTQAKLRKGVTAPDVHLSILCEVSPLGHHEK